MPKPGDLTAVSRRWLEEVAAKLEASEAADRQAGQTFSGVRL